MIKRPPVDLAGGIRCSSCAFWFVLLACWLLGPDQSPGQTAAVHPVPRDEPPVFRQLKSRTDDLRLEALLTRSMNESESFRQSILQDARLGARLIGSACDAFRNSDTIQQWAAETNYDLRRFSLNHSQIVDAIEGTRDLAAVGDIYGPFQGKWYGLWENKKVDHHWGQCVIVGPPKPITLNSGGQSTLVAYQYAWVGDGYGINYVMQASDSNQQYLLGYVVHVREKNPDNEVARRPHVGVFDGPGRLIWITKSEVFFEELVNGKTQGEDRYYITGFRYNVNQGVLNAKQAFQAIYSRNPTKRSPWRGIDIQLNVTPQARASVD